MTTSAPIQTPPAATPEATLRANLAALALHAPALARRIAQAEPRAGLEWAETEQGPAAALDGRWLASRRRPLDEARRLGESVDIRAAGCVCVVGFGLGLHVGALAQRMGRTGLIVVYEPDVELLRAVLERIDHSGWLGGAQVRFVTGAQDSGEISAALHAAEPFVALGVKMLEHPPSRVRLAHLAPMFSAAFAAAVAAVRTVVVTTMVQTEVTVANALGNADHYLVGAADNSAGVADLVNLCAGRPAVVVSAGPSLTRTIDALAAPGLRDRCVIICVQTALKQLLARGIKPHFVTALDYHRISARFYEGLTASDVEGVTLVAEPKVHPAAPDAFPGAIRCPADENLDILLGDLAGLHGVLPPGSTVAHLAHYLARHLGCDPVILTGQDLGFTDGQYYSAGAAIHNVWACELSPFSTLEMFEWERIARGKATLRRATDHDGRTIYTDEQMATYLAQFERDFLLDTQRGLAVIDATEGGVAKRHTAAMPIREALERHAPASAPPLPPIPAPPSLGAPPDRLRRAAIERITRVRRDAGRLAELSRRTRALLEEARDHQQDRKRLARLIDKVHERRDEAHTLEPAFSLVQRLNQTGAFNRARADRDIQLDEGLAPLERERRQIERDITNVSWLADAADSLAAMLKDALRTLDPATPGGAALGGTALRAVRSAPDTESNARPNPAPAASPVAAVLVEDLAADDAALRQTITRLTRVGALAKIIILTTNAQRARARLGALAGRAVIEQADLTDELARAERIAAARRFSPTSWRGGVGAMTCWDDALCPDATAAALDRAGCVAAFVVRPDAVRLDTDLCARVIARHHDDPALRRIAFSQAPPDTAGVVIDRALLADITDAAREHSPFASIGGLLRYIPTRPMADPIAKPVCEPIDHALRDCAGADSGDAPAHLVLELTTARRTRTGALARWLDLPANDERMTTDEALRLIDQLASLRTGAALTLAGRGDPLLHPDAPRIVEAARGAGVATHVRTDLRAGDEALDALLAAKPDIVSVDCFATTGATYEAIAGENAFTEMMQRMQRLCQTRSLVLASPAPWVVARATRCDLVYEEIEPFYDAWTMRLGACALDPLPRPMPGERIAPLPPPPSAQARLGREVMVVRAGGAIADTLDERACAPALDTRAGGLAAAWRSLLQRRGIQ